MTEMQGAPRGVPVKPAPERGALELLADDLDEARRHTDSAEGRLSRLLAEPAPRRVGERNPT